MTVLETVRDPETKKAEEAYSFLQSMVNDLNGFLGRHDEHELAESAYRKATGRAPPKIENRPFKYVLEDAAAMERQSAKDDDVSAYHNALLTKKLFADRLLEKWGPHVKLCSYGLKEIGYHVELLNVGDAFIEDNKLNIDGGPGSEYIGKRIRQVVQELT